MPCVKPSFAPQTGVIRSIGPHAEHWDRAHKNWRHTEQQGPFQSMVLMSFSKVFSSESKPLSRASAKTQRVSTYSSVVQKDTFQNQSIVFNWTNCFRKKLNG